MKSGATLGAPGLVGRDDPMAKIFEKILEGWAMGVLGGVVVRKVSTQMRQVLAENGHFPRSVAVRGGLPKVAEPVLTNSALPQFLQ